MKTQEEVGPGTPRPVAPESLLEGDHHEEEAPVGTLFFMVIFLLLMVALWGTSYWLLLKR